MRRCMLRVCVGGLALAWAAGVAALGANVIVNGDAEAGAGSADGFAPVTIPGWTAVGPFIVVQYAAGAGFPGASDPGPPSRGLNFFAGGDARPVLSSLQNRNRILIQARVLIDAGDLRAPGAYGFDKAAWARAQENYSPAFGGDTEKSSYNLFTQNQWYAGKLVSTGRLPALRRLIDNQQEFLAAFEEIIRRPHDQETVLREMAVRCLT